jgi:hypothetical protein
MSGAPQMQGAFLFKAFFCHPELVSGSSNECLIMILVWIPAFAGMTFIEIVNN